MDSPLKTIAQLKEKGLPLAFVGDVVGTGSSRKSAINSVLWHMGNDIDYVHGEFNFFWQFVFTGKPVSICPRINYLLGEGIIG
jgi:aconitase B